MNIKLEMTKTARQFSRHAEIQEIHVSIPRKHEMTIKMRKDLDNNAGRDILRARKFDVNIKPSLTAYIVYTIHDY